MSSSTQIQTPFHSAVASWSGYNYQGKVALYVALDYMNDLKQEEYVKYSLELEWFEDFSVKKDECYLSIHQVKSYKRKYFSEYKEAIWNLLGKSIENESITTYIHTSESIDSMDEIKRKLLALKQPSENLKKYSPAYYHKIATENNNFDKAFSSFSKYDYCSNLDFCPLDKIDNLVKEKIKEYYKLQEQTVTSEQVTNVFLRLLGRINEHITKGHVTEQRTTGKPNPDIINFMAIYEILKADWEQPSENYFIYHLKHAFYNYCEEFIEAIYKVDHISLENKKRIDEYLVMIGLMEDNGFLDLCKHITPHISVPKMDMEKFRRLIPYNGMKEGLLVTLILVNKNLIKDRHLFEKKSGKVSEYYLPTTIDEKPQESFFSQDAIIGNVAIGILNNSHIDEFLFEVDVIISRFISMHSLEDSANKIMQLPGEESPEVSEYNNITKIKKIRMVNMTIAGEELK